MYDVTGKLGSLTQRYLIDRQYTLCVCDVDPGDHSGLLCSPLWNKENDFDKCEESSNTMQLV